MKIGILTQPLHTNYGGLLQAWALQNTLVKMGHQAIIINRVDNPKSHKRPLWRRTLAHIKNEILIIIGKKKRYVCVTDDLKEFSEQNVIKFRQNRYKGISPEITSNEELIDFISRHNFDAYIVGSDQVWRPMYSPNLMTYFLDFVKTNNRVKKIAYAASFGVDKWEFSPKETEEAAKLAPLFDLLTVRENSGVNLVEKYLKCKATHVLDPTMLHSKEEYEILINESTCQLHKSDGELFCYVLDSAKYMDEVITQCSKYFNYRPYYCNYQNHVSKLTKENSKYDCLVPPVEQWLKSFLDAKMVITDSFHGAVFSIIFNKPFWVISNNARGAARFKSLLEDFGLEKRLITNVDINWHHTIDWDTVNKHRKLRMTQSTDLLIKTLQS